MCIYTSVKQTSGPSRNSECFFSSVPAWEESYCKAGPAEQEGSPTCSRTCCCFWIRTCVGGGGRPRCCPACQFSPGCRGNGAWSTATQQAYSAVAGPSSIAPLMSSAGRQLLSSTVSARFLEENIPAQAEAHLDAGPSAAGFTAPRQHGETALSIMGPTLQGLGGSRLGAQEGSRRPVGGISILDMTPGSSRSPSSGESSPAVAWGFAESRVSSVSGVEASMQSRTGEGDKEVEAPRLDATARGEVYVCFEGPLGAP